MHGDDLSKSFLHCFQDSHKRGSVKRTNGIEFMTGAGVVGDKTK